MDILKFVDFLIANPPFMWLFVGTLYLILLAMFLIPGFVPTRQHGNPLTFTLSENQNAFLKFEPFSVIRISASSEKEFVLETGDLKIESKAFNRFTHIAHGHTRVQGLLKVTSKGTVDIQAENTLGEINLVLNSSKSQKIASICASILVTILLVVPPWMILSGTR
ncbi:MAG: hypothetical protein HYV90_02530 [Candidatus Woesebacteria bacterium]|nr:MAG: hypothetical protein HYV90_02530 [Candidatus Woesebacteria bacterium]